MSEWLTDVVRIDEGATTRLWDEEVIEVSVLLNGRQAEALERAARRRGTTAGALLRRLLTAFLSDDAGSTQRQQVC
ncbi:MAG TPA: hypothetical protein VMS17_19210 [Gemmataceae bacterium]|nr:hypothetical protein [Gemmataceae bacterium]